MKIVNIWWEGNNLLTEDDKGRIFQFENASIENIDIIPENNENIIMEKVSISTGEIK